MFQGSIRKDNKVIYQNAAGRKQSAHCIGNGWKNGRRIVFLDNGSWCCRTEVQAVIVDQVPKKKKSTVFSFVLKDQDVASVAKLAGSVEASGDTLLLRFAGYGDYTSVDGCGAPVFVEFWQGKLRLVVWADINQEEPTHLIDLSSALETNRQA